MTAFNYAATAATATRLLERFGAAATLNRQTAGAYDPDTGTAPVTVAELATTVAVFDYDQKYIDGTLIKQGDKRAYMAPTQQPKQGDVVNARDPADGVYRDYTVIAAKGIGPAGTPVLYEAQIRGG